MKKGGFPLAVKSHSLAALADLKQVKGVYAKMAALMDRVEQLTLPLECKNYSALCEVFGEKPAGGKSKQLQLGRFSQAATLSRTGSYGWRIEKANSRHKVVRTMTATALRSSILCEALLSEIKKGNCIPLETESRYEHLKETFVKIPIAREQLFYSIGLMNKHFFEIKYGKQLQHKEKSLQEFFWEVQSYSLAYSVKAALEVMERSKAVIVTIGYEIRQEGQKRVSSEWETAKINDIYIKGFRKFGCLNLHELYFRNLARQYYNYVDELLQKQLSISYCKEIFIITTGETTLRNFAALSLPKLEHLPMLYLESNARSVVSLSRYFQAVYNRFLRYEGERVLVEGRSLKTEKYKTLDKNYLPQREQYIASYIAF